MPRPSRKKALDHDSDSGSENSSSDVGFSKSWPCAVFLDEENQTSIGKFRSPRFVKDTNASLTWSAKPETEPWMGFSIRFALGRGNDDDGFGIRYQGTFPSTLPLEMEFLMSNSQSKIWYPELFKEILASCQVPSRSFHLHSRGCHQRPPSTRTRMEEEDRIHTPQGVTRERFPRKDRWLLRAVRKSRQCGPRVVQRQCTHRRLKAPTGTFRPKAIHHPCLCNS